MTYLTCKNYIKNVSSSSRITITGVGLGLPGKDKAVFDENNVEMLLNGKNFISKIDKQKIAFQRRQNIIQKKKVNGEIQFKNLSDDDDLVHLAGESGSFDLITEYGIGNGLIDAWEITTQLAIAAGLEALKDAGIPLLKKENNFSLPADMVDDTGVIFASTFPAANTFLEEQRKFYEHYQNLENKRMASELIEQLGETYREIVNNVLLEGKEDQYNFDRKYLLKAIPIQSGNFAQIINAKGPNTGINAACASTTQAIALAEDWIKLGRCKRVIVIAADDPTNEETFHWIATGFLAAGAATTEPEIEKAARPFDQLRTGMILGMGAVGIVVEDNEEAIKRGVNPIVEVLGTHFANSAFHATRMNPNHVKQSFQFFMEQMNEKHGLKVEDVASSCLYMSHETFTPPKGNGAKTEVESLRFVFGDSTSDIIVSNTKGLTAHPMGVSFEDVAVVKSLQFGKIPPVANLETPEFSDVRFSKGEIQSVQYAIRFAAGFGSQLVYILFRNLNVTERFSTNYSVWLKSLGEGQLQKMGKTLIYSDK